jgi:ketosteroid isomerase-like protein
MQPTKQEISNEFSRANFSFCYEHFTNNVEWKIIGDRTLKGKEDVIAFCEQMSSEIIGSTFNNFNAVTENDYIVIEGKCEYTSGDKQPGHVSYCDIFRFDDKKISSITSYCIEY